MISSVGLEHYLDRVGVTGSNPVSLTIEKLLHLYVVAFLLKVPLDFSYRKTRELHIR